MVRIVNKTSRKEWHVMAHKEWVRIRCIERNLWAEDSKWVNEGYNF